MTDLISTHRTCGLFSADALIRLFHTCVGLGTYRRFQRCSSPVDAGLKFSPSLHDESGVNHFVAMPDFQHAPVHPEANRTAAHDVEQMLKVLRASKEPMWVFDTETLVFLEVNEAAISRYGYTREQFLNMTILDIRPVEDVAYILRDELRDRKHSADAEIWRHKTRSGNIFKVRITSHEVSFMGRIAEIVTAEMVNL
jgi:PAS domain S-box-containing protein